MRLGRALGIVAIVLVLSPSVALAHAYPVQSDPLPNATLGHPPSRVQITFSEALEPNLSRVTVYDSRARTVQDGPSRVIPNVPSVVVAPLAPRLPNGSYTVVWHVVAADDGHSTAGVFVFGVGVAPGAPVVTPGALGAEQGDRATPVGVVGRWLVYLGSVLAVGTATFVLLALRSGEERSRPVARLVALLGLALAVLMVGQVLRLLDELSLSFDEPAVAAVRDGNLGVLLLGSRFGQLWLARTGLALAGGVLAGCQVRCRGRAVESRWANRFWIACIALGAALLADLAWSGHAADGNLLAYAGLVQSTIGWSARSALYLPIAAALVGAARTISLVVDWLHLASVSTWIGGTIALAVAIPTTRRSDVEKDGRARWIGAMVTRHSKVAAISMVVVILTGIYNTWLNLAGPASYLTTGYGESLLLKHAAVLALLALAAINHFVTVPSLTHRKAAVALPSTVLRTLAGRPSRPLRLEAGLGVLVLLSTGLLTSLAPTRSPQQILFDPTSELALASPANRSPRPEPSDARASQLLDRARDAMSRLQSVRMVESLTDGAGGLSLTTYTFAAPDREEIVSPNGGAVVQIASTVYRRERGRTDWTVERDASPFPWPTGEFDYLEQGIGATVVGERSLSGQTCAIVAFYEPRSGAIYEDWIGVRDGLIHQEVMVAPSHFMVDRYQDFNTAPPIEAPVARVG